MTKSSVFQNAATEVQLKAQWITCQRTPEEAMAEFNRTSGYICALYDTGVFDHETFRIASDLLKAAKNAALQVIEKRTDLGAANTESGSTKEGRPMGDKSLAHTQSIAIIFSNVKRGGDAE